MYVNYFFYPVDEFVINLHKRQYRLRSQSTINDNASTTTHPSCVVPTSSDNNPPLVCCLPFDDHPPLVFRQMVNFQSFGYPVFALSEICGLITVDELRTLSIGYQALLILGVCHGRLASLSTHTLWFAEPVYIDTDARKSDALFADGLLCWPSGLF